MPRKLAGPEEMLLSRLRAGDESAFASLVDELHGKLLSLARTFTRSPSLAEDIVQETWFAVIRGLPAFEGRSALRTWVYGILIRRARTLAVRESREARRMETLNPSVNGDAGTVEWEPGMGSLGLWEKIPRPWPIEDPSEIYQSQEALGVVRTAIELLPEAQRQVLLLRDVEGLSALEVCNVLQLSETNQRVLLHRGRARIRRALDRYLREGALPPPPAPPSAAPTGGRR
ncbi:MAG: RNA polymerase sigma factor [Candidatus Eiseniibacteriota bacterium]